MQERALRKIGPSKGEAARRRGRTSSRRAAPVSADGRGLLHVAGMTRLRWFPPALITAVAAFAWSVAPAAAEHSVTNLLSVGPAGGDRPFSASFRRASADGTRICFTTDEQLVPGDGDASRDVYERGGGVTALVSDRVQPGADLETAAQCQAMSADGDRIHFMTDEPLVVDDTDTSDDVYERAGGVTRLLSDRQQAGADGASDVDFEDASTDGTRVVFHTSEPLVADDDDASQDAYQWADGVTTLLSDRVPTAGVDSGDHAEFGGASADGTRVFFVTAEQLDPTVDTDASYDVYQWAGGVTRLVSDRVRPGADGAEDASFRAASDDGSRVFFASREPLTGDDGDATADIYERAGGQTTLLTHGAIGPIFTDVSDDGSRVFFVSTEALSSEDGDASYDVYERSGGTTTLLSDRLTPGPDVNKPVQFRAISTDGTRVFFEADEPLVPADGDGAQQDTYVRTAGQTTLVSDSPEGTDGQFSAYFEGISADGTRVFFETGEALVAADGDTTWDVYERAGTTTTLISDRVQPGSDGAFNSYFNGVSADGNRVFLETPEPLVAADTDASADVYTIRIPQPPDTTIAGGPDGPTTEATPEFTLVASEPGSRFECRIDDRAFAACASPFTSDALVDGTHTFSARAIDGEGDTDPTPATRAFVVDSQSDLPLATPPGTTVGATPAFTFPSGPAPAPSTEVDTRAPVVSGAGMTRKRFRAGRRGSTFRFRLSEPARVTIAIARTTSGRRVGRRCVTRKPSNRTRSRCTRAAAIGRLTHTGPSGVNRVALTGRLGKVRLKPGTYRAAITATDPAGNRSRAVRLRFTVLRPAAVEGASRT